VPAASLVLFARTPVLGAVKTRLCPPLTPDGALALYVGFLEDAARVYAGSAQWSPVLAALPEPDDAVLARLFCPPWRRSRQVGPDLGARLVAAFEAERARGAPAVLAVGSDHPALGAALIARAFASLREGCDAAVVPAEDGGYCAIALGNRAEPRLVFGGVPWSTPDVLAATLGRLDGAGLSTRVLEAAYDVDRAEDLDRLRRDLARRDPAGSDFPRATAEALARLDRAEVS